MNSRLCKCGCGRPTEIADQKTNKGKTNIYLHGHNQRGKNQNGHKGIRRSSRERFVDQNGYVRVRKSTTAVEFVYEHVLMAERTLGKPLPKEAVVHHVDENKQRNINSNLVICQDRSYHKIVHLRMRALSCCGNANWRSCSYCHRWDAPTAMIFHGNECYHRECRNEYKRNKRRNANGIK